MRPLRIGIVAESTQLTLRAAVEAAARMGARGLQIDATGDLSPDALGGTGRREFRNLLRSFDLELAALNVPTRRGLDVVEEGVGEVARAGAGEKLGQCAAIDDAAFKTATGGLEDKLRHICERIHAYGDVPVGGGR